MDTDFSGARDDGHLIELWLTDRPESTVRVYREVINGWKRPQIRQLTVADILEWSQTLRGTAATRARWIATVKSLLSFAWRTGYTPINVGRMLRCGKVPDDLHERILPVEDVKRLVDAAPAGRDRTLIKLLYIAGVRIAEAVGLRPIDVGPRRVTVTGKGKKTRTLMVPDSLVEDLKALAGDLEKTHHIFRGRQGPIGVRTARDIIYRAAETAGLRTQPHSIRHSHASHSLDGGAPIHLVQKCLGHRNVATTSRYLHVRPGTGSSQFLPEI